MKRTFDPDKSYAARRGDIKRDFTTEQLAAIGAIAMNFNEAEAFIDLLLFEVTSLPKALRLEVSSRINGIDGKIEIISKGIAALGLEKRDVKQLTVALGAGRFKMVKSLRDSVVHARIHNAPLATGVRVDRRAAVHDVLLSKKALDALYEHIESVKHELHDAFLLTFVTRALKELAADDPQTKPLELGRSVYAAQFRAHPNHSRSLPQLPEFPEESELKLAQDAWIQETLAEVRAKVAALETPRFQP